jgi:hypothetical protein
VNISVNIDRKDKSIKRLEDSRRSINCFEQSFNEILEDKPLTTLGNSSSLSHSRASNEQRRSKPQYPKN